MICMSYALLLLPRTYSVLTRHRIIAVGPPKQVIQSLDSINTSSGAVWGVVDAKEVPETSFPVWTDVRDIAKIHVLGATEEIAKGKRYAEAIAFLEGQRR